MLSHCRQSWVNCLSRCGRLSNMKRTEMASLMCGEEEESRLPGGLSGTQAVFVRERNEGQRDAKLTFIQAKTHTDVHIRKVQLFG